MKRNTSSHLQGALFSDLVDSKPSRKNSNVWAVGPKADVQASANDDLIATQSIKQASTSDAAAKVVNPVCVISEGITPETVAADVYTAEPTPGAGRQVGPFDVRNIIDTAFVGEGYFAPVARERGHDQRRIDDVSGRAPTPETKDPGRGAVVSDCGVKILVETVAPAAASKAACDAAHDLENPGTPGTVGAEPLPSIILVDHQTEGGHRTAGSSSHDIDANGTGADRPDHLNFNDENQVVGEQEIANTRCTAKVGLAAGTSIEGLRETGSTGGLVCMPKNDPDKPGSPAIGPRSAKNPGQSSLGSGIGGNETEIIRQKVVPAAKSLFTGEDADDRAAAAFCAASGSPGTVGTHNPSSRAECTAEAGQNRDVAPDVVGEDDLPDNSLYGAGYDHSSHHSAPVDRELSFSEISTEQFITIQDSEVCGPTATLGSVGIGLEGGANVDKTTSLPQGNQMSLTPNTSNISNAEKSDASSSPWRGRKRIYDDLPDYYVNGQDKAAPAEIPRDAYFRAINNQIEGDQPPLRKLWKLGEFEQKHFSKLPLTKEGLAGLLRKHKLHNNPDRYAGQILICLDRLVKRYPNLFTAHYESVIDTRIHHLPPEKVPAALNANIATWMAKVPIKIEGRKNAIDALAVDTIESYVRNIYTIAAALPLCRIRLDPTVDIAFLIQRVAVTRWLKVLKTSMARDTISGLIASLLRVAKDLPGQSESDIAFLKARLSEIMDDLALDADDIGRLAIWTEPEKHRCLLAAPDTLMKMAEDERKMPSSRILSSAAGFALILMWEHPALTEKAIAAFDYERDIEGEPGSRKVLRLRPAVDRQSAGLVAERMSAEAERLLDRLIAVRKNMSLPTTLLLPGKNNRPRPVSSAMESIYNQIQGVLSDRMTSSDLRDLNAYIALEDRDVDLALVAEGLGYQDSRSLERRFGKHLRRNPSSGGV